ncbi:SPASM domain-containing protein [Desulfovibrio sp. OttesenSCG-928-M14]|nr:SPASM domain-containing protein [Desulfovibrio sp. OttesenSCG-928-M14]
MKSSYAASMLRRGTKPDWPALLPLNGPWMVHLEPTAACNLRCRCCFHGDQDNLRQTGFKKDFLEMELYKKTIEGVASMGAPTKTLRLFKAGESLLHPDFVEMVRFAKERLPDVAVVLRTNGVLLRPELNRQLIEAGLDQLEVSVNAMSTEGYNANTGVSVPFISLVDNVRDFYAQRKQCHVYVKATSQFFTEEDKKAFFETFGDISDSIFLEHIAAVWAHFQSDAAEMQEQYGVRGEEIRVRKVCPFPFIMMAVNADGSVSPCANDWNRNVVIGDISAQTVEEIWNSAAFTELRKMHATGRKDETACGDCQFYAAVEDDFDAFAEELARKL